MKLDALLKRPTAYLPLLMSLSALAILVGYIAIFGVTQDSNADEGLAAHTFQLLLIGQLPLMAVFAFKWVRQYPWEGLAVLAAQVGAIVAAFATVIFLEM